jgi:mannan endo-1,4-beta-mannosidase
MGRIFRLGASLILAVMCGTMHAAPPEKGDFVSVKGTHFVRHGKPYCISGANFWYGGYLGAAGVVGNRARLVKELDSLKAIGVNNVRVLAVSEQTAMASAVRPTTTIAPG